MKLIWFCAAGYSFFTGISLIGLAIIMSAAAKNRWHKILVYAACLISVFFIYLSATPLALWFYFLWTASLLIWIISISSSKVRKNFRRSTIFLVLCLSTAALIAEIPYTRNTRSLDGNFEKLYIIGDSVSSGIGNDSEQTWPKLFRTNNQIEVVDLATAGATVKTAMKQAVQVKPEKALILLEIGGNDLFAPTPYPEFRSYLTKLIKTVDHRENKIAMLELPLLPWHSEYGRIQRDISSKYNICLVPKRHFVKIISTRGACTDLAHLSPKGHKIMAKEMWAVLKTSFQESQK